MGEALRKDFEPVTPFLTSTIVMSALGAMAAKAGGNISVNIILEQLELMTYGNANHDVFGELLDYLLGIEDTAAEASAATQYFSGNALTTWLEEEGAGEASAEFAGKEAGEEMLEEAGENAFSEYVEGLIEKGGESTMEEAGEEVFFEAAEEVGEEVGASMLEEVGGMVASAFEGVAETGALIAAGAGIEILIALAAVAGVFLIVYVAEKSPKMKELNSGTLAKLESHADYYLKDPNSSSNSSTSQANSHANEHFQNYLHHIAQKAVSSPELLSSKLSGGGGGGMSKRSTTITTPIALTATSTGNPLLDAAAASSNKNKRDSSLLRNLF